MIGISHPIGSIKHSIRQNGPAIITIVVLVILAEVAVVVLRIPQFLFPRPSVVLQYLVNNFGRIWFHTTTTLYEVLLGFGLGCAAGVAIAIAIVYSPMLKRVALPLILANEVIPKIAVAPLILLWLGYGATSKVVITALISFFPVIMAASFGMLNVESNLLDLAESYRSGAFKVFSKIRLPNAMPFILNGMKVASSLAVIGAVVGEFVGANAGLGYLIVLGNYTANTPMLFSSLIMLTIMGIVLYAFIALLERIVVPWHAAMLERMR